MPLSLPYLNNKNKKENHDPHDHNNNNNVIVAFETSMGITFRIELFCTQQPITTGNFLDLIQLQSQPSDNSNNDDINNNKSFYQNTFIHRIIPNYIIQLGCPYTRNNPYNPNAGLGGPKPYTTFTSAINHNHIITRDQYGNIPDEYVTTSKKISNTKGTIAMANTGAPNTGGSQFFINMNDNLYFDWFNKSTDTAHVVFGKILEQDYTMIEHQIATIPTNEEDVPKVPIEIINVYIVD